MTWTQLFTQKMDAFRSRNAWFTEVSGDGLSWTLLKLNYKDEALQLRHQSSEQQSKKTRWSVKLNVLSEWRSSGPGGALRSKMSRQSAARCFSKVSSEFCINKTQPAAFKTPSEPQLDSSWSRRVQFADRKQRFEEKRDETAQWSRWLTIVDVDIETFSSSHPDVVIVLV